AASGAGRSAIYKSADAPSRSNGLAGDTVQDGAPMSACVRALGCPVGRMSWCPGPAPAQLATCPSDAQSVLAGAHRKQCEVRAIRRILVIGALAAVVLAWGLAGVVAFRPSSAPASGLHAA